MLSFVNSATRSGAPRPGVGWLSEKERDLASGMLAHFAQVLPTSIFGSTWVFPDHWTQAERQSFLLEFNAWGGNLTPGDFDRQTLDATRVAEFLAYRMRTAAEEYTHA